MADGILTDKKWAASFTNYIADIKQHVRKTNTSAFPDFTFTETFIFEAGLTSNTKKVKVPTPVLLFEDGDIWFAYLPSFRLTGYDTSLQGTLKSRTVVIEESFTGIIQEGTLIKDIDKCG